MQCEADHETIEAYALGKLQDSELDVHVLTCRLCQERILEVRSWDTFLHRAKKQLIDVAKPSGGERR